MSELARFEIGSFRVAGDVTAEGLKLFDGTDEVVEAVLLPEAVGCSELAVELHGLIVLPALALSQHSLFTDERGQQMDVIRHHDNVGQFVPITVEFQQAVADDSR